MTADRAGWSRGVVVGLMAVHAILAGFGLGRESLWLDEVMSIDIATGTWEEIRGWFVLLPEQHPLYYALLRPWLALFGDSDVALRSFSLVAGVASVGTIFLLARRLLPTAVAVAASGLLAISPFWLYYSQEGRMYTLLVFLVTLSCILFLDREGEYERAPRGVPWGYWLVGVLGMYTHIFFAFVVMSHAAVVLLLRDGPWSKRVRAALLISVPIAVGYIPWLVLVLVNLPEGQGWKGIEHIVFGIPYTFVRFAVGYSELLANYRWQERIGELLREEAVVLTLAVVTHAALFIRGALHIRTAERRTRVFLSVGLLLPLLLPLLLTPIVVLTGERYFMVVLPIYLSILAAGVVAFGRDLAAAAPRRVAGTLVLAGFATLSGLTLLSYYTDPDFGKEQWEEVVEVLETSPPGTPIVVAPGYSARTLLYHLPSPREADVVRWEGGRIPAASGGRIWLLSAQLEDPQKVIAALPEGWSEVNRVLYPNNTGIWLIEAASGAQGRP